jgi:hypothetical protein
MASPFDSRRDADGYSGNKPFADMIPGETRTMVGPKNGVAVTITRTDRPFVYDWVDSSNVNLAHDSGFVWIVGPDQTPKLIAKRYASQGEREVSPTRITSRARELVAA